MWTRIKTWFTAPVFPEDEERTRQAQLLNVMVNVGLCVTGIAAIAAPIIMAQPIPSLVSLVVLASAILTTRLLLNSGKVRAASLVFTIITWLGLVAIFLLAGGIPSIDAVFLIASSLIVGLLLGQRVAILSAIINSLIALFTLVLRLTGTPLPSIFPVPPISAWFMFTLALALSVTVVNLAFRNAETAIRQARLYAAELEQQRTQLERAMQERTEDLARRTRALEAATRVARETSAALGDDQRLLAQVTALLSEQLVLKGVSVYRFDQGQQRLSFVAAAGQQAAQLQTEAEHSPAGGPLLANWACVNQQARHTGDPISEAALPLMVAGHVLGVLYVRPGVETGMDHDDLAVLQGIADQVAAALENTRLYTQTSTALSEANTFRALVEASGQGIGMISLQGELVYANPALREMFGVSAKEAQASPVVNFYGNEMRAQVVREVIPTTLQTGNWSGELTILSKTGKNIPTLNTVFLIRDEQGQPLFIANIVADITERKTSEARLQDTLRETERLSRAMSREGWRSFFETTQLPAFAFDQHEVKAVIPAPSSPETAADTQPVAMPLSVRGEAIGAVEVESDPTNPLTPDEYDLLRQITEQGAVALEAARLFDQTQSNAERERTINRITGQIRNAQSVDQVLEIAAQELSAFMRASRSVVEITPDTTSATERH